MKRPTLSVVIPTHNGRALLGPCLESIRRFRPADFDVEVVVVDDASADDSVDWISTYHPDFVLIRLEQNGGFCAAANAGIAAAQGKFIQLLNNDAEVCEGWAEAGIAPMLTNSKVGSVAPLVLVRSNSERVDSAGDSYAFFGWPTKRGHGQSSQFWAEHPSDEIFGASASSAFYRADLLRLIGGFDPSFGSYYEDVDLAFRLRWAGATCQFQPSCRVLHDVSASYDHGSSRLHRRMSRNAEVLFWSNLPRFWLLVAIVPHLLFLLVQLVWKLVRGRGRPFLAGKLDAVLDWRRVIRGRQQRRLLARSSQNRPAFRLGLAPFRSVVDHINRPIGTGALAKMPGT